MGKYYLTLPMLLAIIWPYSYAASDTIQEAVLIHSSDPIIPANEQNIYEGWVEIQFDIDETGKPTNRRVSRAEPARVFNRSAMHAIGRWRYSPATKDGVPIVQKGNIVRLVFKME